MTLSSDQIARYLSLRWSVYSDGSAFRHYLDEWYGETYAGAPPFKYMVLLDVPGGDIKRNILHGPANSIWRVDESGMQEAPHLLYRWADDGKHFAEIALVRFFREEDQILVAESLGMGLAQRWLYTVQFRENAWFISEPVVVWTTRSKNRPAQPNWTRLD